VIIEGRNRGKWISGGLQGEFVRISSGKRFGTIRGQLVMDVTGFYEDFEKKTASRGYGCARLDGRSFMILISGGLKTMRRHRRADRPVDAGVFVSTPPECLRPT
jgi:hypothetical protein